MTSPVGFGGPLVRHMTGEETLAAFRAEIDDWCHANAVVSEFVRFHPLLETRLGMERHLDIEEAGKIVWARLDRGGCALIETLSVPARRNIRRAREAGLTCGVERGDDAWDRFAELYLENALRRKALPAYRFDAAHFRALRELLGPAAVLFGARLDGRARRRRRSSCAATTSSTSTPWAPTGSSPGCARPTCSSSRPCSGPAAPRRRP